MRFEFKTAPNKRNPVGNEVTCSRCGGNGIFFTRVHNGVGIPAEPDDGICYRCHGTGVDPYYNNEKENDIMNATLLKEAKSYGFDLTAGNIEDIEELKLVLEAKKSNLNGLIDPFVQYIDDGRQYREAEESNNRLHKEISEIDKLIKLVEDFETTIRNAIDLDHMMQELNDHGYMFSRPLSEEEIKKEYADMLEDLELENDIANGMDPVEALKKSLNNDNNKEDVTMTKLTLTKEAALQMTREELRTSIELIVGPISNTYFRNSNKSVLADRLLEETRACGQNLVAVEEPASQVVPFIMDTHKVCCGTGRRPKDLYGYEKANYLPMVEKMKKAVIWFYESKDVRTFITGGAQGWDQLLFWAVNAVKRDTKYSDIKNIVYAPMIGQDFKWSADGLFGKKEYQLMLSMADEVKYVTELNNTASKKDVIDAMLGRNHAMVNASDYVFGCYPDDTWFQKNTKGGTAECLRYAYNKRVDTTIMYYNTGVSKFYEFSKVAKEVK